MKSRSICCLNSRFRSRGVVSVSKSFLQLQCKTRNYYKLQSSFVLIIALSRKRKKKKKKIIKSPTLRIMRLSRERIQQIRNG